MIINRSVSIYDPTESIARSYQKAGVCGKPIATSHTKITVCLNSMCPARLIEVKLGCHHRRSKTLLGDFRVSIDINRDITTS